MVSHRNMCCEIWVGKAFRGSSGIAFGAKVELGTLLGFARRVGETGLELGREGARDRAGVPGVEVLHNCQ